MKTEATIKKYVRAFKEAQAAEKAAKEAKEAAAKWLLNAGNVVDDFENIPEVKGLFDVFGLTYVAATVRNSVDTKTLKSDYPEIYKKLLKVSTTKNFLK